MKNTIVGRRFPLLTSRADHMQQIAFGRSTEDLARTMRELGSPIISGNHGRLAAKHHRKDAYLRCCDFCARNLRNKTTPQHSLSGS